MYAKSARRAALGAWIPFLLSGTVSAAEPAPPEDFPRFVVPGREREMESLRGLFWLHYRGAGPLIPLWDEWMPMSTLWPAVGSGKGLDAMRVRWAAAFAGRIIDAEGYVHTQQHDGLAHAAGWPFPLWTQAGGIGWHFRGTGVPGYDGPPATPEGWKLARARAGPVGDRGWEIDLEEPRAIAEAPFFSIDARIAPWIRINWWASGLEAADPWIEWTTGDEPEFSPERRAYFSPPRAGPPDPGGGALSSPEARTMVPVGRLGGWKGRITGLRIGFENRGPARVVLKSVHTACDTRHTINNFNFVRGSHDYFLWTRDVSFLRDQAGRIRTAMRFAIREFQTRERKCVYVTWPGHEGRSGIRYVDGKKTVIAGEGIGGNYWDLLPFGGEDALGTVYLYDALLDLAELEEEIAAHPEWCISGADAFDPEDLRRHAREVRDYGTRRFWNEETGRFGTRDLDGRLYDYGFTFLACEAVCYGFATPEEARSIHAWLSGERIVETDTSRGADIYRWRFGPRSTTKRNVDWYFWGWSSPESIPFGCQVQDGGAVLGFSYHDLLARIQTAGPDDAARRLYEICAWFDETQAAGGYRAYYADPKRGTLQGGNVPGGLGIDKEFFESILVPQVMLYGFLGFRPTGQGCEIAPRLPSDWPSLAITRIRLHDAVIDVAVRGREIEVSCREKPERAIEVRSPPGWSATVR